LAINAPATFKGNFRSTDDSFTSFSKTLASLAIAEYNGKIGRSGYISAYYADFPYVHSSYYDSTCQALTDQAALDYYGWAITSKVDISYASLIEVSGLAALDTIIYSHNAIGIKTRLIRDPFFICPDTSADTAAETQLIRIPAQTPQNSVGDYLGYIQEYDFVNNAYVDSRQVWVRNVNP
jgi:hypothetical protein